MSSPRLKKSIWQSTGVRVGVPMLAFMIGGCYVLSEFMQTHMEMKDKKMKSQTQRKFDLDEEHRTMLAKLNLEKGYTLSRIPRPDDAPAPAPSLQGLAQKKKKESEQEKDKEK